MIDYRVILTGERKYQYKMKDIDEETESNRGRIVNSPAIRRLQQKTQVFPLEINAAVRSRLTHSLEVQQNARYLARTIIKKMSERKLLKKYHLNGLEHAFVSTVEMASLMHDIGNPPFGYFGELAINNWMKKEGINSLNTALNIKNDSLLSEKNNILKKKIEKDISNFEGNAQGIRIVHTLQALNLTYSQTSSILKYTRSAYEEKPLKGKMSYLKKKPGFYLSEEEFVKEMYKKLLIKEGRRHPLAYIMEAADDIAYGIADLEDGVDKGILSLKKLFESIVSEANKYGSEGVYIKNLATKQYDNAKKKRLLQVNTFIINFRSILVNDLVDYASEIYIENHKKIYKGTFNNALLESKKTQYECSLKILKTIAIKYIFKHPEVEMLELKGNTAISGLLEQYKPLLKLQFSKFKLLLDNEKNYSPIESRLFNRLSSKHINAYMQSLEELNTSKFKGLEFNLYEWYYRSRLIIDFISGMTDEFAIKEYQLLSAIK